MSDDSDQSDEELFFNCLEDNFPDSLDISFPSKGAKNLFNEIYFNGCLEFNYEKLLEKKQKSNKTEIDSYEVIEIETIACFRADSLLPVDDEADKDKIKKSLREDVKVDEFGFLMTESIENQATPKNNKTLPSEKWLKLNSQYLNCSEDRKKKIQSRIRKGIPNELRGTLWKTLSGINLILKDASKTYKQLLEQTTPFENQIKVDLGRSLPHHIFYEEKGGEGQTAMFNVLKAFSIYDKKVGYCQGMSFICAVFLLYFSEEETFAVLCRLIKDYELSGLFEPGFPTLRKCLYIHDQLLEFWLPRLSAHFKAQGVETSMYAFAWYSTLFVNSLSFAFIVRIFDIFLAEGMNILYRISIGILKLMQKQLLASSFDEIVLKLRNLKKYFHATPSALISSGADFALTTKRLEKLEREYNDKKSGKP